MKLKRILAMLVAAAMVTSIMPMTFAATADVNIDFDTTTGFSEWKVASNRATNNVVTDIYGNATKSMNISSPTGKTFTGSTGVRAYEEGVSVSKTATHLSFRIAAADTNSRKAVSFDTGAAAPGTAVFEMAKDGKMYVLGTEICAYETGRWYQVDVLIKSTGAFEVYIDGGNVNPTKTTGTAAESAILTDIFGEDTADIEERNLYYYMLEKSDSTVTSNMYVDDFKTVVSDEESEATISDDGKLIYTYTGSATFVNRTMKNLPNGATVEGILADFTMTKGTVKILDGSNQAVTTGALVPGMKLVLSSVNESIKLEYAIDCLNLVLTVPGEGESTRDLTKTVSVTFNGAGTVEFYVNDSLVDTVSSAPYEYTIQHGITSSAYTVKAVVVTAGDARTETDTKTYDFVANEVPTIALAPTSPAAGDSIKNGDTATITATATDPDYADGPVSGITKLQIYFNGSKVAEETCAPAATLTATYNTTNLTRGSYSYYVKAYDADGAEVTTDTINFSAVESAETVKDTADFENGISGVWSEFQTTKFTDVTDPAIREGTVKAYDATQSGQALYMKNDTNFFSGITTLYWEMDMMTSDPSSNKTYLQVRGPNDGSGEPQTRLYTSDFGMEANKWYKIRYIVNASTGAEKVEVYEYSGTGLNDTVTLKTVLTPSTANRALVSFASVRIYVNENGGTGYNFYMDNIKLYTVDESTYVSGSSYANNQFVLSYNNPVEKYQFDETNFKVTDSEGKEVKDFSVATVTGDITLTFNGLIESQETYTVELVNLDSRLESGTAASYTFTTPAKSFDVLKSETTANADGTGAQIKFNAATGAQVEVIYAIFSGDKLIGIKRVTPDFTQGLVQNIPAVDWIGTGSDKTAKVFVWSGVTGARTVHTDVID